MRGLRDVSLRGRGTDSVGRLCTAVPSPVRGLRPWWAREGSRTGA